MNLHPMYAIGILLVGWFGFAIRRSSIGGIVSGLIVFQGLLSILGMAAFLDRKGGAGQGPVMLWTVFAAMMVFLVVTAALALRQYLAHRSVQWEKNEEIRH